MATGPDDVRFLGKTGSSRPTTKMTRLTQHCRVTDHHVTFCHVPGRRPKDPFLNEPRWRAPRLCDMWHRADRHHGSALDHTSRTRLGQPRPSQLVVDAVATKHTHPVRPARRWFVRSRLR